MAKFNYGGQAVIEGVMMRGRYHMAVAVREQDGTIRMHEEQLKGALYNSPIVKVPFVRGIAMLGETLALGMRALMWSAEVTASDKTGEEVEFGKGAIWGMMGTALLVAIGLFFVTPLFLTHLIDQLGGGPVVSNLVEGGIRLALVLLYIWGIGHLPDIHRVFAFHGAEHKAVNAHEAGVPLDVEHVRGFSTQHTRCGTSFLLMLVVISVFVFAAVGQLSLEWKVLSRIVLVPVIAAIAYEALRLAARYSTNPIVRFIYRPNLALQNFTTREPDDSQVEVAVVALKRVLELDAVTAAEKEAEAAARAQRVPAVQMG